MTRPKWTRVQLIASDSERTFAGNEQYDAERQFIVNIPGGAEEYAFYGWFKAELLNQYWTPLFRVATRQTYGDVDYLGDRDLATWINWPGMAALPIISQYSPDNWNRGQWFPREDEDLQDWFWMYMGYSYAKKRVVAFIRYNDHERQIILDDVN